MAKGKQFSGRLKGEDKIQSAYFSLQLKKVVNELLDAIKTDGGLSRALKSLSPKHSSDEIYDVTGIVGREPSGTWSTVGETENGDRVVIVGGQRIDRKVDDPQMISNVTLNDECLSTESLPTSDELITKLSWSGLQAPLPLIAEIELTRFDATQRVELLPLLWRFILGNRESNHRETLVAVGSAIRKFVAIMPLEEMSKLTSLLDAGHKATLPIELEIEVVKMIYRNFEVRPPVVSNPYPELAHRLWEITQAYTNPRVLPHGKHSTVALLSIQALVAMQSDFANQALLLAAESPYRWFSELVEDGLERLQARWVEKQAACVPWLNALRTTIVAAT